MRALMSETNRPDTELSTSTTAPSAAIHNPPGQSQLSYRIGTYETFFRAMLERLSTQRVPGLTQPPLAALTTRAPDDPAIALLDSWAVVGDVITFYQERIANEGYLRTAIENRSVLELARSIGYEYSPGVAASAMLAFMVSTTPGTPPVITIPKGTQVKSVPAPGQASQTFETIAPIEARAEWNTLKPRLTQSQSVGKDTTALYLAGTNTQLQPGQVLLFDDQVTPAHSELRVLRTVTPDSDRNTTHVTWDEKLQRDWGHPSSVLTFRQQLPIFGYNAPAWNSVLDEVKAGSQGPSPIRCVALSPDGKLMASGHDDGNIWLWTIEADGSTSSTPIEGAHQGAVHSVAFSPDFATDRHILSGGADGKLKLWKTSADFKPPEGTLVTLDGDALEVNSVGFSPNYHTDHQVLSGGADKTVKLWTLSHTSGSVTANLTGHEDAVNSVAFSPNFATDHQVLSGSADKTVKLWTLSHTSGPVIADLTGHELWVSSVAFSPNYAHDHQVLSGSGDKTVKLWDVSTPSTLVTLEGPKEAVTSVAFSSNYDTDRQVLAGSMDATLQLWTLASDYTSATSTVSLDGHVLSVNAVAFRPGVSAAVSASSDKTLRYWDIRQASLTQTWLPNETESEWPGFALSSNELHLSIEDPKIGKGDQVVLFNLSTGSPVWQSFQVERVTTVAQQQFSLSAKVTCLTLNTAIHAAKAFNRRTAVLLAQSQSLALAATPIGFVLPCNTTEFQLDRAVEGLQAGQRLALRGEIAAAGEKSGSSTWQSEIVQLKTIAMGDSSHTQLTFEMGLTNAYIRHTVTLNANIADATHGETVANEVLGSGDGTQSNQHFSLKQQPLTYVSAPPPRAPKAP